MKVKEELIIQLNIKRHKGTVRADYRWHDENGDVYIIKDVPLDSQMNEQSIHLNHYVSESVAIMLEIVTYMQFTKELPNEIDFSNVENLMPKDW